MGNQFSKKTRKKAGSIQAQRIFRSRWFKSLVAMGSAVVFFTVYSLIIPAATLTEDQAAADSGIVLEEPAPSEPQVVETEETPAPEPAPEEAPKEEPVAQAAVEETPAAASEETAAQTPVEETGTAPSAEQGTSESAAAGSGSEETKDDAPADTADLNQTASAVDTTETASDGIKTEETDTALTEEETAEDATTESSEESAEETTEEEEEIGTVSELKAASGNLEALVRFADGAGIPENASLVIYGAGADTGKVQEALWSGSMDSIEQSSITTDLSEYVSFAVKDADGNDITPDSDCSIEISFGSEANLSDPGENRIRKYGSLVVSSDGNVSVTGTDLSTGNGHTYATFTGTLSGNTFGFAVTTADRKVNYLESLSGKTSDGAVEAALSFGKDAKVPEGSSLTVETASVNESGVLDKFWGDEEGVNRDTAKADDVRSVKFVIRDRNGNEVWPETRVSVKLTFHHEADLSEAAEGFVKKHNALAAGPDGTITLGSGALSAGNGITTVSFADVSAKSAFGYAVTTAEKKIVYATKLTGKSEDGSIEASLRLTEEAKIPEGSILKVTPVTGESVQKTLLDNIWTDTSIIDPDTIRLTDSGLAKVTITDKDGKVRKPEADAVLTLTFNKKADLAEAARKMVKRARAVEMTEENVKLSDSGLSVAEGKTRISYTGIVDGQTFGYAVSTAKQKTNFLEGKLSYEGEDYTIEVSVSKDNQIPENSKLNVKELDKDSEEFKKKLDQAAEAVQKDAEKKSSDDIETSVDDASVRMFDITILNEDGDEIQPNGNVRVSVQYKNAVKVGADAKMKAVHFDEKNDEVQVLTPETKADTSDTEKKVHEVRFNANGFSVYAIVGTESITTTYLTADGSTYEVTVTYGEEAGISEGAQLLVTEFTEEDAEYDDYVEQTAAMIDSEAASLSYIKVLDISILDTDGEKVTLKAPVDVQIRLLDKDSINDDIQIVHFAEDADTDTIDPELLENTADGDTVTFQTDSFSAYAIVQGPAAIQPGWARVSSLTELNEKAAAGLYIGSTGNRYLRNNTTAHSNGNNTIQGLSGIERSSNNRAYPTDDAALYYFEPVEGQSSQFYIYCLDGSGNKLYATYDTTATAVPYSIILTTDETLKTPCTLSVSGTGNYATWKIRFNNDNNLRWYQHDNIFDAQNKDTSYYIWYYIGTDQDSYDLDGKTYGLMYWIDGIMGKGLMADSNETAGNLDALALTVMSKPKNGAKLYVPDNSDLSFWTFHFIEEDYYYLTTVVDGSTKYLRIGIASEGLSLVSTPDDKCKIRVVPGTGSNAGKICLKIENRTLAYSGDVDSGFKIGGTAGSEWLNLVEESELTNDYFMTYSAQKVSVSDESITNGSRIIIYTRVWNDTTKKYEFYAVDQDGSLVRCYESGDSIEWVGGRLNSMLWNFVEYYWEGTTDPNYYYDLYNQYSDQFLAPQKSNDQILSDGTIGLNLNGRRNGLYYSPIVAWDDAYYAYAGLKADTTTGKVVSCPLSEADDFYFAIVQDLPVDDELTTVSTVDHEQYGITMKMVNFGTDLYVGNNNSSVRLQMSDYLGSDNAFHQYNTEAGLLNTRLGDSGYPITKAGNDLSTWFADRPEVNHLFTASTYNATGYFEYDSVQNFAHLDQSANEFVVYKEIGSDNVTGATHTHGLFWPYNDITAGIFSVNKNTTDISSAALSESDPRKYETMYLVQKSNTNFAPDYYFGMEVTATFTQTPNGLDDWGHDIIYEFTGDDDFWLFVDGELIIDLGGIHSAISGDVNYKTGVVHVNGKETSLRELFKSNYRSRNPDKSDTEVEEYLNEIFDGKIFKDYTTHTMKIYYLERGAGSSNLHMRFNLASIKPGTAQLTKKLSGVTTAETVLAEFPYQIIYRTKTGDTISNPKYLSNAVPGGEDPERNTNYVFYKDSTVPCTYERSKQIAGKTYQDVFILKPDETVDINFPTDTFPEGTELYDYRIIECGVNTSVYQEVKANDAVIKGTGVIDDQNNTVQERADFGIEYATTDERARVVYDNKVNPDAITNLTITKRLFDVTGQWEISEAEDNTTFDFRLYLATDSGDIDSSPASMHTYHVKDASRNYCYWSVEQQRLLSLGDGKNNFDELTDDEQKSATFHTSMNGSISKIPVGYTIEIRELLAGTKFKIVERPWEIPDGYSFLKYVYNTAVYTDAAAGVIDSISSDTPSHVEVQNIKGFGLRVNKTWTDADFMSDRDPVYFGIFYEGSSNNWQPVEGSLMQMAYGTTTLYWYYNHLPVEGITDFDKYVIYEVELDNPVVDSNGKVTGYSKLHRLEDKGSVTLSGKQAGDTESSSFTYTVEYERGEVSSNSNVRVDEVTNNRPGIIIKKTRWDGQEALEGAVFTLTYGDDNILIGTYTSGEDGLITEAFLRENVAYHLTETSAPQGWYGLEAPMTITLNNDIIRITGVDSNYYTVMTDQSTDIVTIAVKNRPYDFKVIKMDRGSGQPLQGVKFSLYREIVVGSVHSWDPNPYPGYENLISGADGIVIGNTLPAGKYQLRETAALSGYQTLSGYITFTVNDLGGVALEANAPEEAELTTEIQDNGSLLYQITVTNSKVFKVSIWKTDEGFNTITTGAAFSLYKAEDYNDTTGTVNEGAAAVVSGTTRENGILALGNLTVGEYRLIETQAPAGYNLATSAVKIFVTNDGVTASQASQSSYVYQKGDTYWAAGQDNNTWQIRVWNNPGVELPMTGGPGTLIYTLSGIALMLGAALVYCFRMRRRRKEVNT